MCERGGGGAVSCRGSRRRGDPGPSMVGRLGCEQGLEIREGRRRRPRSGSTQRPVAEDRTAAAPGRGARLHGSRAPRRVPARSRTATAGCAGHARLSRPGRRSVPPRGRDRGPILGVRRTARRPARISASQAHRGPARGGRAGSPDSAGLGGGHRGAPGTRQGNRRAASCRGTSASQLSGASLRDHRQRPRGAPPPVARPAARNCRERGVPGLCAKGGTRSVDLRSSSCQLVLRERTAHPPRGDGRRRAGGGDEGGGRRRDRFRGHGPARAPG